MAGLGTTAYNLIFKRSSTFALTILVGAVFFERSFDMASEKIFDKLNEGKLWKHIKHKYEN